MRYRRSVLFLLAWIAGIFMGTQAVSTLPIIVLLLILISIAFLSKRILISLCLVVLAFSLAASYGRHWRRAHWRAVRPGISSFTGLILMSPDLRDKNQLVVVLSDDPIGQDVHGNPARIRVLVTADRYLPLTTGQRLRVKSTVEPPQRKGVFHYPLYLEQRRISAIARRAEVTVLEQTPKLFHPLDPFTVIRQWCEYRIAKSLSDPEASFAAGLVLGSRKLMPANLQDDLKLTGTTHLIAVSGANITFMIGGLLAVSPYRTRRQRAALILAGATAIAAITGGSASVVRGATAVSISTLIQACSRKPWPLVSFLLVMAILLTFSPLMLRADPSFQLSCSAYGGLLALSSWVTKALQQVRFPAFLSQSLSETVAATIGTAPLSLAMGTFTPWGLLANPLVLWIIPYATLWSFLVILVGWIPIISVICGLVAWAILHLALSSITFSARIAEVFS
jgi:competence protein ComEC